MNPVRLSSLWAAHSAALCCAVVWGITFVSTKVLLSIFAPAEILFLRFLLGMIALWCVCPHRLRVDGARHELLFAGAGLCGVTLYFLLENIALQYTLASNVGVLVAISPLFTALLARILLGEQLRLRFFVGFAFALTGIVCINVNSGAVLRLNPLGDLLAMLAALTWAFYSILTRKIGQLGHDTTLATRRIFGWGLLLMLPVLPFAGVSADVDRLFLPLAAGNLLFLGLGASALCFVLWNFALTRLGPVCVSQYIYLIPLVTVGTSLLVLGEPVTLLAVLGMALILAGLTISEGRFRIRKR